MKIATSLLALALGSTTPSHAGTIGPNDFGPSAYVETFDPNTVGNYSGDAVATWGTISLGGSYRMLLKTTAQSYDCIVDYCLGNNVTGATWNIVLTDPVDRVGGYLGGGNLVPSQTRIYFYDINDALLGYAFPIPILTISPSPAFFGFQTEAGRIKRVWIDPQNGLSVTTLDNFTFEIVPPSSVPLAPSAVVHLTALGLLALLAWRRKRKDAIKAAA
jgi:hypothetical protein